MTLIPSQNKFRYLLPNLLSEAVIGMIFEESKISVHFGGILGTFILLQNNQPNVYNVMQAYKPLSKNKILNPVFTNPFHYIFLLFQISTALLNAQEKFKFTHYDLHIDNILLDDWSPDNEGNINKYIRYKIDGKTVVVSRQHCPFIAKITDYGLSLSLIHI